ncbi:MAG TPA: amidohydrolase family protein, partial [Thermodesulfobacteriota bacterium]|nr:amidohydrolase family protein [Thermodesulfobacteriota bacterium]
MRNEELSLRKIDLLVVNGTLLPLSPGSEPIPGGYVAVAANRIVALGPASEAGGYAAEKTIDASGCVVMPGLINGHTHSAMSLFRGVADDLPLKTWLEEYIFPVERNCLGPGFVYWGALLACAEMIRSGTTCFADGYYFEEEVAKAAGKAGLRALLGQGIIDFEVPGCPTLSECLSRFESMVDEFSDSSLMTVGLFPHSTYTCSPALLEKCRDTAERFGTPLLIHLAETRNEVEEVSKEFGNTP